MTTTLAENTHNKNINDNTPGTLRVIKRDGRVAPYNPEHIRIAITKAFLAVEGNQSTQSDRVQEITDRISQKITLLFNHRWPSGGTIHIEAIQDKVELILMQENQHAVASAYLLYREKRREERQKAKIQSTEKEKTNQQINVTMPDGSTYAMPFSKLGDILHKACENLTHVNPDHLLNDATQTLFDGMDYNDLHQALILASRTHIETEPNYTFVTARLLLQQLTEKALKKLNIPFQFENILNGKHYTTAFKSYIAQGISLELLNPKLNDFDLDTLANALLPERDLNFTYLSLQTLADRYFIHHNDTRIELPQIFFMRVSMGLALNEGKHKTTKAIEFYQLLSSFDYMSSTPTLFNAGTRYSQLSSCFLTSVPDSLNAIFSGLKDNAMLSKFAGGLGNDWTPVRALGSHIKGTNGKSLGIVPFLNVSDAIAVAVNQGGKRKGAVCAYLETWHLDIEEFLHLRKNTGDERRRTHDMNTANWIPDLFMERVFENKDWTLFSPDETPDLHETYGEEFKKRYLAYEIAAKNNEVRSKTISAVQLWRKMLGMLFETGHPWMTFKDPCNLRSPQQHCGVIHSSNLCTEITLNTQSSKTTNIETDEVAVCNLGSINLANHIKQGQLDLNHLQKTIKTAIRMLDNVIDINFYPIPQAKNANTRHRPIGLGLMGFVDALYEQKLSYASEEAVQFADYSMECISYYAIEASMELAKEKGAYQTFPGSLWSEGILPIDSIQKLAKTRGQYLQQDTHSRLDWDTLRNEVKTHGVRNSNIMAIAPTATISNICGVSQSIEPTYQNLFVKSNLSGEFTVINPYLIKDLKQRNLWDNVMVNDLKYYNGSVQAISRIPDELKTRYVTAFEINPKWLIESASRRQKWIDQAQSLNLYMAEPNGKKLDMLYRMCWVKGLKTTYYLRSLAATSTEKSTIHDGKLNAVQSTPKVCSIDNPDCEACQ